MSIILPPVITSWEPPAWATESTPGDSIEYRHVVGELAGREADRLSVAVVQIDELTAAPGIVSVHRHPAAIFVAGVRLTPGEAFQLADLLQSAISLIEGNWLPSA